MQSTVGSLSLDCIALSLILANPDYDATAILIPHDILRILFTWINTLFIAQDNTAIRQVHLKIELNTNVNVASYAVWLLQNA